MVSTQDKIAHKPLPPSVLCAQNISFGYDAQPLLQDVSLAITSGEMVGLLGPNGSGKTTLLRLLSGALKPQRGQVLLEGRSLTAWGRREVARRIAVVPQQLHIPYALTVADIVGLGRTPFINTFFGSQSRQDQDIVVQALKDAGVSHLATRVFNELSGGERQRVMIAMALAQEPTILLLDEPTSHLDIKYQVETLELVQRLMQDRHVTIIAALHDLNLAARYFSRLVLFQRGIIADAGPTAVLEPGLLKRVYGTTVHVGIVRGSEHVSVLPPARCAQTKEQPPEIEPLVHVIAGSGSGELLMRALADVHIPFSAGVLSISDSDYWLARRLAARVVTVPPYAPITPEAVQELQTYLAQVTVLILAPLPISYGNLIVLQEAVNFAQQGLPIILLTQPASSEMGALERESKVKSELQDISNTVCDYTDGKGVALMEQLLDCGAVVVDSVGSALDFAKRYIAAHNTL